MRILPLLLVLLCPSAFAQPTDSIYTIVSEPPALLPSQEEAYVQIGRFFQYPEEAAADSVVGMVLLRLVVDTTGLATVESVLRSPGRGCDEAARDVVQYVRFSPGIYDRRVVRTYVMLPVPCRPSALPREPAPPPQEIRIGACTTDEIDLPEILPNYATGLRRMQASIRYPEEAKKLQRQGRVIVRFTLGTDGRPRDAYVPQPLGFGLDDEARRAVSALHFRPAKCKGEPVEIQMTLPVTFGLR